MQKRSKWFNEARYGLFIHWGAYSKAARGEWVMNRERIPLEEYRECYVKQFKAEHYDPADWMKKAVRWGMKYTVLTTRHHDGFALWDSKVNPYNAAKLGPGRDLVAPYVKAVREAGLKVGLYYSPASWAHPDYPGACFRDWPGEKDWKSEAHRKRFIDYYRAELKELMTGYGKIDYLWFDGCIPENIEGEETIAMLRELQPEMLINNRLGTPFDIKVSEQTINPAAPGQDWEACMTLNENWGYHSGDHSWKNPAAVISMLMTCAKSSGNLLLNIGPKADGTIPEESVKILDAAGEWLKHNREAITDSERSPFTWNNTARLITVKGNRIYITFEHEPGGQFCWSELKNRLCRAWWLDDGTPIQFRQEPDRLFLLNLPPNLPLRTAVLEVEGKPEALTAQTTFWIPE